MKQKLGYGYFFERQQMLKTSIVNRYHVIPENLRLL